MIKERRIILMRASNYEESCRKEKKSFYFFRVEGGERAECYPGVAGLVTINLSAPAKIYHSLPSPIGPGPRHVRAAHLS